MNLVAVYRFIPMNKIILRRPTLLLDPIKCQKNIHRMVEKASNEHLKLRPHFKTHQSAQIGEWIRAEGINQCGDLLGGVRQFVARPEVSFWQIHISIGAMDPGAADTSPVDQAECKISTDFAGKTNTTFCW